jgi:hypothetical protein
MRVMRAGGVRAWPSADVRPPSVSRRRRAHNRRRAHDGGASVVVSYDAATGQYTYVWRTSSQLAGRCGRLELGLEDGSDHHALFRCTR